MSLKGFMKEAYKGKAREKRRLKTRDGDFVLGFEDFVQKVGDRPTWSEVEKLAPSDEKLLFGLIKTGPRAKKHDQIVWGFLSSLVAERIPEPLMLPAMDFAGLELRKGTIVLDGGRGAHHVGENMSGGRIVVKGEAGDYLGQEMAGGGIVAGSCGDYAFRKMRGGWGVVLGRAGDYLGLGNRGGRIVAKEMVGSRTGWLMESGRICVGGDAGSYLGIMMKGGRVLVKGEGGAAARAGWRMRGGAIYARGYGPEVGAGKVGGKIYRRRGP